MAGDTQVVHCPLSMTDGRARGTPSFNVSSVGTDIPYSPGITWDACSERERVLASC